MKLNDQNTSRIITETIAAAIESFNTLPSVKSYDRALRIKATLAAAGFRIVKAPVRKNVGPRWKTAPLHDIDLD